MAARLVAALVTCRVANACNFPEAAVTVTVPAPTAVTLPAATLAIVESDVFHCAEAVRSLLLPSLYLPMTLNCWLAPGARLATAGLTWSEPSDGITGGGGLVLLDEPPDPQAASVKVNERTISTFETFVMVLSPTCSCKSILLGNFPFS